MSEETRDLLAAEAEAYRKGLATGRMEGEAIGATKLADQIRARHQAEAQARYLGGRLHEADRRAKVEWRKLFVLQLLATFIAILALYLGSQTFARPQLTTQEAINDVQMVTSLKDYCRQHAHTPGFMIQFPRDAT